MSESSALPRRLAVFGAYSDHDLYQRNRILAQSLEALSDKTVYVRPAGQGSSGASTHGFSAGSGVLSRLLRLLADGRSLWSQRALLHDCDTVFVPYPAYLDVLLLWVLGQLHSKTVVVDAFLELHSTVVDDRKLIPADSLRARLLRTFQRFTLGKADIVLIDTAPQAQLLRDLLHGTRAAVAEVPVGIDERIWQALPAPAKQQPVRVLFWGTFIPLHGVEHIVAAARILDGQGMKLEFYLVGDGQTADDVAANLAASPLASLHWERRIVDTITLRQSINKAHIVLGVFGDSDKAAAVVPYKVHQALACNRPTITRSGPATNPLECREAGLILCPPADPEALARAIRDLVLKIQGNWSPSTRKIYERYLSQQVVSDRLRDILTASRYSAP